MDAIKIAKRRIDGPPSVGVHFAGLPEIYMKSAVSGYLIVTPCGAAGITLDTTYFILSRGKAAGRRRRWTNSIDKVTCSGCKAGRGCRP